MAVAKPYIQQCKGNNGLDKFVLKEARGSSVEVYLYGGHVTSWKNDRGEELLFLSRKSLFEPPNRIRGGIPICFPQVGGLENYENHGFVRKLFWAIDQTPPPLEESSYRTFIDLVLKPPEGFYKYWPQTYEFRLRVALTPRGDLILVSRIRNINRNGKPFTFTFAFYAYFSVSDICEVRVEGLETYYYLDNLKNKERFTDQGDSLTFESEIDRSYVGTPNKIAIIDHEKRRTYVLWKEGMPDAVVWNPWDKKAKAIADFGDDEYKRMLCVAPAVIEEPLKLKPGEEWTGSLVISCVPSSYCSGELDPKKILHG
ncbi:putative glucose-6-phosphate 1-epimerase [Dendrobium catenatum]|uniref:glucose-6-phosphate 1-epimerase n=1 Tax=Dendrobium catenatum TaxID=906689 RepID=A0A2I0W991_9ASPA|nr:putative glucose-6-phosphate 1-epimerase [Dendrobium catenatum]PKU72222.1 Putative glucose-6-phosphate 1-epimerase [Dendrobium catenatum]